MKENPWAQLLAYVTGLINQELLLKNEYLAAENRILRAHLPARLRLSDPERSTLAEIAKRLGHKALAQVACVAKPDCPSRKLRRQGFPFAAQMAEANEKIWFGRRGGRYKLLDCDRF